MFDLMPAIGHHLLIFGLFGVLFAELVLVQPGLSAQSVATLSKIDLGALSVPPTLAFIRWRPSARRPPHPRSSRCGGFLRTQIALFALLPLFAAAMARGYGAEVL